MKTVTLDALIPREDFDILSELGGNNNTRNKATLSIEDLKYDSFFFSALRKPIFQRETNEWEPSKICGIIESFIESELIPSIILWRNQGGYIFVIDGAHRLSSLGAWINDDYNELRNLPEYKYLQTEIIDNEEVEIRGHFSRGRRQQIKLQTFVSNLPKCPICGGYLDNYSISVDHIIRKSDGGSNAKANGQVTHLYCNTTYKN